MLLLIFLINVGKTACFQQNQVKTWAELSRKPFTSTQTEDSGLRASTLIFQIRCSVCFLPPLTRKILFQLKCVYNTFTTTEILFLKHENKE